MVDKGQFGGNMQVGTIVKLDEWFGVVMGLWTHDVSEIKYVLVKWLSGRYTGDTDAISPNDLEVICK